jgi:hypothetical protein
VLFSLIVSSALAAPPGLTLLPFGIGVYAHGKPLRGAAYTVTQAGGIVAATAGSLYASDAAEAGDEASLDKWGAVASAGVATALASYAVALFDGSILHDRQEKAKESAESVRAWDAAVLAAREER